MKLAALFPGVGYNCDMPLLNYSGKLAKAYSYEIIRVNYGGFPSKIKGNAENMKLAFMSALSQAEEILKDINWKRCDDVLFISKSIGTVVASAYAKIHELSVRNIYYTPVVQTFDYAREGGGIVFHGNADPWADTDIVKSECKKLNLPFHIVENANHSLETGNVVEDIKNLGEIMVSTEKYINAL